MSEKVPDYVSLDMFLVCRPDKKASCKRNIETPKHYYPDCRLISRLA